MSQVVFISFADKKYYKSLRRLEGELREIPVFTNYHLFTEKDLGQDFLRDFHPWLYRRGYGYWKWKPYLVQRELSKLSDGDILIWSDAGTVLNKNGIKRLNEYLEMAKSSKTGILAFQDRFFEKQYTKGDVFAHFGVLDNEEFVCERQFWGGLSVICKSTTSQAIVDEWWRTVRDNFHLITDKRSSVPNFPEFIDARHDQSVFSVLMKKHHVDFVPYTEFDKENYDHIPFLPIRNKQKTKGQNISGKLLLPWRMALGLYLKYIKHFVFKNRVAW